MKLRLHILSTLRLKALLLTALVLTALLLASACGASSPPARGTALLTIVPPAITETKHSGITDGQHVVFTPVDLDAPASQRIYVHLTESNTTPTAADPMWGVMANAGARVIVLAHQTLDVTEVQCEVNCPSADEEFEIRSAHIPELLTTLLQHLAASAPADGWDAFLSSSGSSEAVTWDNIILAGHRDGAGRAAYLGSTHPVDRVVLFGGPIDKRYFDEAATDVDDRVIAFSNAEDLAPDREPIWESVGVPTNETRWSTASDLDQSASSLRGNRFISEIAPIDGFNPRNDWQHRRYQSLWEYVCCE